MLKIRKDWAIQLGERSLTTFYFTVKLRIELVLYDRRFSFCSASCSLQS